MRIFLSYASEYQEAAEEVSIALQGSGHEVFFDKASLQPGGDYRRRLREAIDESELFIFLISPESVAPDSFARTELAIASKKWKNPENHVLPVMLRETPLELVPAYLKAVTILEPEGDVAAQVSACVDKWSPLEEVDLRSEVLKLEEIPSVGWLAAICYQRAAFPHEVAQKGQPTKTYRKTHRWSMDRKGKPCDEPTTLTARRSQDFVDEEGRTCCDVTCSWYLHGEELPEWDTTAFCLDRGEWKPLGIREQFRQKRK
jgi:hypothetical protein